MKKFEVTVYQQTTSTYVVEAGNESAAVSLVNESSRLEPSKKSVHLELAAKEYVPDAAMLATGSRESLG